MKPYIPFLLSGLCLLISCGGGSIAPSPKVSLSPATLTFAPEVEGTSSAPQNVTLSNSGTATLNITSITGSADFELSNTFGSTLESGAKCGISVTFTPSTPDSFTGSILVTDNAPGSPQMVPLSGMGTAPTCSIQGQTCGLGSLPCCAGLVCPGQEFCGRDNQPYRCQQVGRGPLWKLKD